MARRSRSPRPVRRYSRTLRVNEVVREALAEELDRMSDPRLEMVTLTGVEVSPDLRHAFVYYATLANPDETHVALRSAASHLRGSLGRQVTLKYLPALEFRVDPGISAGRRVEEILRDLHREGRSGANGDGPEGGGQEAAGGESEV